MKGGSGRLVRLNKLASYLVTSVLARFLVAGVVLLVLRFGPWGNVFARFGFLAREPSVNRQFDKMAEALEYGATYRDGAGPGSGPGSHGPPKQSVIADLLRKLGLIDRAVWAPEWVPVFAGSIERGTFIQSTPEGTKRIIRAEAPASRSSVVSFYKRAFTQMGYAFTHEQNGTETSLVAQSPDGARTIAVAVGDRGPRSTLVLTHLVRPLPAAP
jgi:hypothetical protein